MAKVIFMGTPQFAVPSLDALIAHHEVLAVVTQPDAPSGRGKALTPSPVKTLAQAHGLPVLQPESLKPAEVVAELRGFAPDLIVVAAFGQILRQVVLDLPRFSCINVHASLLPRWRGASPISAAIAAGDPATGVTIMLMEAGLDSGAILSQRETAIGDNETTGTLTERLARIGAELLVETLPGWLSSEITPRKQDERLVTLAGKLQKTAGRIDWSATTAAIEHHIRAMQPWPSAYTNWQGKQLKILKARTSLEPVLCKQPNGSVRVDRNHIHVQCGDGLLQLLEVQLEGKRAVSADAFARGQTGFEGSALG